MITNHQLAISCLTTCAVRLPKWQKYRNRALYRRTEDFVQWLLIDTSGFDVAVVPHYAIQALAEQFPAEALTLGRRIQDERRVDLWIRPSDWATRNPVLVESIVKQIDPSAFEPLTPQAIIQFLDRFGMGHVSAAVARGIATIITGNVDEGCRYLEEAAKQYGRMDVEWARKGESLIQSWLACTSDVLLPVLRRDAEKGAQLLRLK